MFCFLDCIRQRPTALDSHRPPTILHLLGLGRLGSRSCLRGRSGLGSCNSGLRLDDGGLALRGEISLRLRLGGLLGCAGSGLDVGLDRGALAGGSRLLRDNLRLALGAGGLLGLVTLLALRLAALGLFNGLCGILVVGRLDDLRKSVEDELYAADGIVVAGDDVLDRLRIGVRVDKSDNGDVKTDGFLDGVCLADAVDDDDGAGLLGHIGDAGEVLLKLVELAAENRSLLLVLGELSAVSLGRSLKLAHALDGGADRLGVRERAAEPALGDVELLGRDGRLLDELGSLLLGRDEKNLLASENRIAQELGGVVEHLDGLRQVDDVDSVALVENVAPHLGVPALGLMAEVKSGVKHVLEANAREGGCRHIHFVFSLIF